MQQVETVFSPEHQQVSSQDTRPIPAPETPAPRRAHVLTIEQGAYILIAVLSILFHLWQLDGRALHHDETLHAFYSWKIFRGQPYMHDPLLHGPFLYYTGALMYYLFGDNDFTARLGFALFGTVLTLLPYLIRREIGRPAALLASLYLLISPGFLYMGRFARHDIYSITFEMLIFVGIVRYATSRQPRWLYLIAAAFGCMFTNQETSYLFILIMGIPLAGLLLWRSYKPGMLLLIGLAVAGAALIFVLPGEPEIDTSGNVARDQRGMIVAEEPGPVFGFPPLETADNSYALRVRHRSDTDGGNGLLTNLIGYLDDLWQFFRHPSLLLSIALTLVTLSALGWLIWFRRGPDGLSAWKRARQHDRAVLHIYESLVQDRRLLIALAIFLTIYVFFFTAMLTNILGIITGTTGSLLYWLAQHDVQRGGQPYHYYAVLLLTYEPLAVLWTVIGLVLVGKDWVPRLVRQVRQRRSVEGEDSQAGMSEQDPSPETSYQPYFARLYLPLLLAWWSLAAFAIYTWAGEKMPWLTVHILLPMALLGGWACQRIILGETSRAVHPFLRSHRPLLFACLGMFIVTSGLNYTVMAVFVNASIRTNVPGLLLASLTMVLFLMVIVFAGLNGGWRWALSVLLLCFTLLGGLYSIRSAYRLAYVSGDVPKEMYIYTQTSPDVRRIVNQLKEVSFRRTAGLEMPVYYDNETVWQWYLRNFTNATNMGPRLQSPPPPEVQAVLILKENVDKDPQFSQKVSSFRTQRFPLRWWFPEDQTYRLRRDWRTDPLDEVSLLARLLRAPLADETIKQTWSYLMYRDPRAALGSTDFVVVVRPGIANQVGLGIGADLNALE